MKYTYQSVISQLKKKNYSPCYWLCGDEPFYIDKISIYIENHILTEKERDFNLYVLYGKEINVRQIIELATCFPIMSQRQVIIIKEAQEIQDINKKDAQNLLLNYLQNPLSSTLLVFAYKYKKLPSHSKLQKQIKNYTIFLYTKKVYDNQLPNWIIEYCKEKNISISEKAAIILAEHIGNNLSCIANELDKALAGKKSDQLTISEDYILEYIGISKEYNIFELQSALASKNILKVNRIINYFEMNSKENPVIPIIIVLFNFFTKILLLHQNKGKSKDQLKSLINLNTYNSYIMREYVIAGKNYTLHNILLIIRYLYEADLQLKGIDSVATPNQILKELVFKILYIP